MRRFLTSRAGPDLMLPPWGLAMVAMLSVQLGSALSVDLIDHVGAAGTAWLRLSMGALILMVIAPPPLRSIRRSDIPALVALGVNSGLMTIAFLAAIERIALGTAVAIEFLGPLTVAAIRSHHRRALAWPAMALVGVVLLTQAWRGDINLAGVMFAVLAAVGWGSYIVLTQRVGDRFSGVGSLSITVTIAALTAAVVGIPQAAGNITPVILLAALGLAMLLPVLPWALELIALRRMTPTAFGTLMALEPAMGVVIGLVVLQQRLSLVQVLGICLVVIAGAAAQREGQRTPVATATPETTPEITTVTGTRPSEVGGP